MSKAPRFLKGQITKAANRTSEQLEVASVYRLNEYLTDLNSEFAELKAHFSEQEISAENEREVFNEFSLYEERYYSAKSALKEHIDLKLNKEPGADLNQTVNEKTILELFEKQGEFFDKCSTKLSKKRPEIIMPKIQIPFFSGGYSEWPSFRNLFTSVVANNKELGDIEKLYYLRSFVKGEAAGIIRHFDLVSENFDTAWGALEERYEKPFQVVCAVIDNVMRCEKIRENRTNLRSTCTSLNEAVKILDSLGDYAKSRDPWVIKLFLNKLDEKTVEHWAQAHAGEGTPTLNDFLTFLDHECDTLEYKQPFAFKGEKKPMKSMSTFVVQCFVCSGAHKIFDCDRFKRMSVFEREKLVKAKDRCINCLGSGHFLKSCQSKSRCSICHRNHHSLLHRAGEPKPNSKSDVTSISSGTVSNPPLNSPESFLKCDASLGGRGKAILPTALIRILKWDGSFLSCRALLDSGSQASFISENCFRKLNLRRSGRKVPISAFSSRSTFTSKGSVNVSLSSPHSSKSLAVKMHILNRLVSDLPDRKLKLNKLQDVKSHFNLADPYFDIPAPVDVVLGANVFFDILGSSKYFCAADNIYVLDSALGWIVSGGSDCSDVEDVIVNSVVKGEKSDDLTVLLERFWNLEEPENARTERDEDAECERMFISTTIRDEEGRYNVTLPTRDLSLGNSYDQALRRFLGLERRFERDHELRSKYHELISNFQLKGYLERVPEVELHIPEAHRYFLPHYGIQRKSDVGSKLRIVFDASMRSDNGVSLNDILLTGPNLQRDIFDILSEFRFPRYVFTTDIVQMYRQIKINHPCRNYQRIIWRNETNGELEQWRLTTVTDGESVSPFLALRVLKQLSSDEASSHPLGSKALLCNYMDDFLVGDDCLETLVAKRVDLEAVLDTAGMKLSKYAANDPRVLDGLSESLRAVSEFVSMDETQYVKTLGVCWSPKGDYFTFKFDCYKGLQLTKRSFLSFVARIYDPMGWLSPLTIKLKIMFQEMWQSKLGWDDEILVHQVDEWRVVRNELPECAKLRIDRFLAIEKRIELHGFCDASLKAFGAVVYVRSESPTGFVVKLVAAKTKVAPLKAMSIARLELCGAHLLARLMRRIIRQFVDREVESVCWTDSTTVLAWLNATPRKWGVFVSNRCGHIRELVPDIRWRYIRSAENPADVATRGLSPRDLLSCRNWWGGPEFLRTCFKFEDSKSFTTDLEERKIVVSTAMTGSFIEDLVSRYSSYGKLRRVVAYMLRPLRIIRRIEAFDTHQVTASELREAALILLRAIQTSSFGKMFERLRKGKQIRRHDQHYTLAPFLDDMGMIRVGERMTNTPRAFDSKFPIVLPKGHLVELIVDHTHLIFHHAGIKLTLSIVRSEIFVNGLRNIVRSRIAKCTVCRRYKAETYKPQLGQIPAFRFGSEKPFSVVGADFAGPFLIRPFRTRGKMTVKSYVCAFVCMVTRAVHLELVFGLDVGSLILCLKRFIARRGRCRVIWSDNGRNFLGFSRLLRDYNRAINANIDDPAVNSFLAENLMEWKFIPVYSPHFGGMWESVIKSFKNHLVRCVGGQTLVIEEFSTILSQIEAILNSRPLTPACKSDGDFGFLSPAHLLTGNRSIELSLVPENDRSVPIDCRKRFQNLKNIVNSFWRQWRNDFYNQLLRLHKWIGKGREPKLGDIVLIKRNFDPPTYWRTGVVERLFDGTDGIVRVVNVRSSHSTSRESVRNLVPLVLKTEPSTGGVMLGTERSET